MADEDLRSAVWFFDTKISDESRISGGGLCIDPRGFVLTVAHLVFSPDTEITLDNIDARPYNETGYRVVEVKAHSQFDLALVQVERVSGDTSPIPYVDLGNSVQVNFGEDIIGFVHQDDMTYSLRSGYTCYPLPEQVNLPDINDTTTMFSYQSNAFKRSCQRGAPDAGLFNNVSSENYRTVGSVIRCIDASMHDMHPHLPLVQTKGYFPSSGTSGCPLFRRSNNNLIGLASFEIGDYLYVVPVNFLRKYFDEVKWDININ